MSVNIFIFIGPPGGGKGSLSQICIQDLGWKQLSTGNLCRTHIASQTEIGKKIDFIIKSGNLIPDSIMTDMVEQWLSTDVNLGSTVIFDGYPRTVVQAKALYELLKTKFSAAKLNVVRLIANEPTLVKRLSSRIVCSKKECQAVYSTNPDSSLFPLKIDSCDKCQSALVKRDDDKESAIKERLSIYNKNEKGLLDFYSDLGQNVVEIDADRPIDIVFNDLKKLIN